MLFRNKDGVLVSICKSNYKNDVLYYKAIISIASISTASISTASISTASISTASISTAHAHAPPTQMSQIANTMSRLLQKVEYIQK